MNKIFLDLETTGLNWKIDKIIEICCLKKTNFDNKEYIFHYYLNPENRRISPGAYMVHGIDYKFLKNKPYFKDIINKLIFFIRNSKIIIHNTNFDLKFLNNELKKNGFKNLNHYCYKIIDTLKVSKKIYFNKKNSLKILCKRFGINDSKRIKHGALTDCRLLEEVFINLWIIKNKIEYKINIKKKKYFFKNNNLILKANSYNIKFNKFLINYINFLK
ncbi:exonuclease domain-containing protein [Candidatus Nasuia deltocephalinicola]|uniref:exonuclease domain-containing protein n=1 Tax=Candidatus Nasuia deltocephalincola TaxID=1160784 RepID=UPI00216ADD8E|nr:exonuclease domain-containing protein [Candidatus Nasuia deltocephalinicola]